MKLYGMGQSRSFRVLWALEEAGTDYQYINIEFGDKKGNGIHIADYKSINFEGKVPTLVDGDLILNESGAILNYIAAKCTQHDFMPTQDIQQRAKYDEMCCFVLTELEQGLWTNGKHRFALPKEHRVPDILPTATWEFNKAIKTLQTKFDGNGFVLGNKTLTMADILLSQTLNWAERFKMELPENLLAYKNRMYQRPACQRALEKIESMT
ncbi:MAG: glutathione S-transferase family protein [Marinicellaceae bacterium]